MLLILWFETLGSKVLRKQKGKDCRNQIKMSVDKNDSFTAYRMRDDIIIIQQSERTGKMNKSFKINECTALDGLYLACNSIKIWLYKLIHFNWVS